MKWEYKFDSSVDKKPNESPKNEEFKGPYEIKNKIPLGFFVFFLSMIVVMGIFALIMIFLVNIMGYSLGNPFMIIFFVILLVFFILLVPIVSFRVMKIYAVPIQEFKGKSNTINDIRFINSESYPFEILPDEKYDLILKYKLADEKWRGVLFNGGFKEDYTLYLKFDESKKTAYFCEKIKKLNWKTSYLTPTFTYGFNMAYGVFVVSIDRIKVWDPLQLFKKIADVYVNPTEARWPVFGIILKNGWILKPRMFPSQLRK